MIDIHIDGGLLDKYMHIGIFCDNDLLPLNVSEVIGIGTSQLAEEEALYKCLNIIKNKKIKTKINIYTDSNSLIQLINIKFKEKHIKKHPKVKLIIDILKEITHVKVSWIESKHNKAHKLVKQSIKNIKDDNSSKSIIKYTKEKENNIFSNENIEIKQLKLEIEKKNVIINDLLNTIKKLNNLSINRTAL